MATGATRQLSERARADLEAPALIKRVIKDEAVHARTSWLLAERILPTLPSAELAELADYAGQLIEMVRCTFVTSRLPEEVRRQARRMREVTCEAGLGACPPDEADAVVERTLAASILPRLRGLGVEVPWRELAPIEHGTAGAPLPAQRVEQRRALVAAPRARLTLTMPLGGAFPICAIESCVEKRARPSDPAGGGRRNMCGFADQRRFVRASRMGVLRAPGRGKI